MKRIKKIKVCPVCGKPLTPWLGFSAGILYFCKHCGYVGPIAITKIAGKERNIKSKRNKITGVKDG